MEKNSNSNSNEFSFFSSEYNTICYFSLGIILLQQPELDDIDIDDDHTTTTTNTITNQQQKQLQYQKFRALRAVAIVKRRIAKLQKQRLFLSNFIPSSSTATRSTSTNSTSITRKR